MSSIKRMVTSLRRGNNHNDTPVPNPQCTTASHHQHVKPTQPSTRIEQKHPQPATPTAPSTAPANQSAPTATTNPPPPLASTEPHSTPACRVARLPIPHPAALIQLLQNSKRIATIKKADAERYSLVTALENARDLQVLVRVVERYMPYALTLWDISENLKAKGTNIASGIVWTSALNNPSDAKVKFNAGFGLEVVMLLCLFAVSKLRYVLEMESEFGMQSDQHIIEQIKSAQVAAGVFAYLRDIACPAVIADFAGTPPPELFPETSAMFYSLSLCIAQTLHTRRAALRGMGIKLLAKLSVAACDLAKDVVEKYDACVSAGISLNSELRMAADHLHLLSRGWAFQYFGLSTPVTEHAGVKICALKAAKETLQLAANSPLVGTVAAVDLDMLRKECDEAVRANAIAYQKAIPNVEDLSLPTGRALGAATKFDASRIAAGEIAAQAGVQ